MLIESKNKKYGAGHEHNMLFKLFKFKFKQQNSHLPVLVINSFFVFFNYNHHQTALLNTYCQQIIELNRMNTSYRLKRCLKFIAPTLFT